MKTGVVCYRRSRVIRATLDENKSDEVTTTIEDDVKLDNDVVPINVKQENYGVFNEPRESQVNVDDDSSGSGSDTLLPLQELLDTLNVEVCTSYLQLFGYLS